VRGERVDTKTDSDVGDGPAGPGARFHLAETAAQNGNFYKVSDVKSRISWTAERRQLLRTMWDRGDKVPAIAAALGCNVGAVNVARARFGLTPRRIVSGRPKDPDGLAHKIERVAFTTSRLTEFASEKELVAQTGHQSFEWPRVIVKELVDNGIDACEDAEIPPVIKVTITTGKAGKSMRIVVEDNGPGISPDTVTGIIDYDVRVSSREAYISPRPPRQCAEDDIANGLRGRRQGDGRDLDRSARHQASSHLQR
jgi:anti-sigma regulatory factor (Ser/Thr protein kinase)